jgi:hypothetical protein
VASQGVAGPGVLNRWLVKTSAGLPQFYFCATSILQGAHHEFKHTIEHRIASFCVINKYYISAKLLPVNNFMIERSEQGKTFGQNVLHVGNFR